MLTKVRSYVAARVAVAYMAIVRFCLICAVAVLGLAGEIFAQTTGTTGSSGTEFEEFPKFFNMPSLVTQGISYLTAAAILIVAAVVGWRMTMKLVNMFIRRVG